MKRAWSVLVLVAVILMVGASSVAAKKQPGSGKSYWQMNDFYSGTLEGALLNGGSLELDGAALQTGTDTTGRYNGGTYYFGRFTGPTHSVSFTEAIASWQANTPQGTWIEVELRAQVSGVWTKWYSMGVWHEHDLPFKRHYVGGQGDKSGYVAVDTLVLSKEASAVESRITLFTADPSLTPTVRAYGIAFSNGQDAAGTVPSTGLTSALNVPKRSQMVFPDGGEVWCSPTSTSMVMAYWAGVTGNAALDIPVRTVVGGVWDYAYNGGGNWPFNTAYAAAHGLDAKVVRLASLAEVEQWTAAGVPVIASIAYKKGELTGSPIASSSGHLLVIRGFDAAGNVLTNDPAGATDEDVTITYDRVEFESAWLNNSNGTVYLIYPRGWSTPASDGRW